jgi:hypothetical protein
MKTGIEFYMFYQYKNGAFSKIVKGFLSFEKMKSTLDIPEWLQNPEVIADFMAYQKSKE